jgi:hypothetical protein
MVTAVRISSRDFERGSPAPMLLHRALLSVAVLTASGAQ